ncbi:MAG: hypothetical protein AAFY35_13730 [Pseudomonadota bacterium]
MRQKSKNQHDAAVENVLLPRWMRVAAFLGAVTVAGVVLIALSDGADQTPIEQSPYRSVPQEVLEPGE